MKTQHLLFGLLGVIALTQIADADEVDFGKKIPSAHQVIEALKPATASPDVAPADADYEGDVKKSDTEKSRMIDMNALNIHKAKAKANPATHKSSAVAALSMNITFEYKSAELTDTGKDQLKPVGEALASEQLQHLEFVVEGYTDAIGGVAYNKTLSEERAISVKRFLVDMFHIDPAHIQIIGKGKSDLLDPNNPDSEVNRRVRIVAIK